MLIKNLILVRDAILKLLNELIKSQLNFLIQYFWAKLDPKKSLNLWHCSFVHDISNNSMM